PPARTVSVCRHAQWCSRSAPIAAGQTHARSAAAADATLRDHARGALEPRNIDPNDTTSTLPRRPETASVRLNLRGDLTLSWLIFGERNRAITTLALLPAPRPRGRRPSHCARFAQVFRLCRSEPLCEEFQGTSCHT